MSVPDWLKADPLAALLIRRGYNSDEAYSVCEQVSKMTADGMSELAAIDSVLGFIPLPERERLSQKARADV